MRLYWVALGTLAASLAAPAWAGAPATPAPIAGVGIGAVLALGLGYRALRRRIDRS
jgi:hypothetical protein